MTTISRRTALLGAASLPLLALPTLATPAPLQQGYGIGAVDDILDGKIDFKNVTALHVEGDTLRWVRDIIWLTQDDNAEVKIKKLQEIHKSPKLKHYADTSAMPLEVYTRMYNTLGNPSWFPA